MTRRETDPARRPAVLTGLGVVAPNGIGTERFWKALVGGACVLGPVTREGCTELPLALPEPQRLALGLPVVDSVDALAIDALSWYRSESA